MVALALAIPLLFDFIGGFISQIPEEQMGWLEQLMPINILQDYSLYLWSQWNGKNLYQIGAILAVLLGMSLIAGETGGQTISFLLTRPISRKQVYGTKVTAGVLSLLFIICFSTFALLMSASLFSSYSIEYGRIITAALITAFGLVLIFSLAVFFSTIFDDAVKAGGATLLVLLVSSLMGWIPVTRSFSLFAHISGSQYIFQGVFPVIPVLVMMGATMGLWMAGAVIFEKKQF